METSRAHVVRSSLVPRRRARTTFHVLTVEVCIKSIKAPKYSPQMDQSASINYQAVEEPTNISITPSLDIEKMHSRSVSNDQQEPHGSWRDPTDIALSADSSPRLEDQNPRLHSVASECYSKCFSAGLGPLCLKFDAEPDGKGELARLVRMHYRSTSPPAVQSTELILNLGTDSQFTITAPGPFEDEEEAESFVLWKVLSDGIIQCPLSPSMERFVTTPIRVTESTSSYSRITSGNRHQIESWHISNEEDVDQLDDSEEIDEEALRTTTIKTKQQTRSRLPCTPTPLNCTYNLCRFTQRSGTASETSPSLFARRYQHLPPNPYGPPLQRSYGPTPRNGLLRVENRSLSKALFLTSPRALRQYRVQPFSSEEPTSPSAQQTHHSCIRRSSQENGELVNHSTPALPPLRSDPKAFNTPIKQAQALQSQ